MNIPKTLGLLTALVIIAGTIGVLEHRKAGPAAYQGPTIELKLPERPDAPPEELVAKENRFERAKEIVAPSGFVNTGGKPIRLSDYIGKKVILLDIMTYSCVNCVRTFPYLVDWYKKYEDKGLIIIGIHTPEFEFEKVQSNVEAAMKKHGIEFPVVLDNDYGTWSAYKNLYWPRKYLIDIDGFIRYDHIGEGGYEETEQAIRELLTERATALGEKVNLDMPMAEDGAPPVQPGQSPETYLGTRRNADSKQFLKGDWQVTEEYATNPAAGASIVYPFMAKKVFLVAVADKPVTADIYIDGTLTKTMTFFASELYEVYSGAAFGSHDLEIRTKGAGLQAYAFTFGS
jgi:thiol-disulfide isomerase/thioredoxin